MNEDSAAIKKQLEELKEENERLKSELLEAHNANVAKEAFLSNMSHDIRTPMNAIIGMTALAKKHIDEKGRVNDALSKIETAGAHLLSLINDVLDMSRINSGKLQISEELFSLGDLLHETLTLTRPLAEQRKHTFVFDTKEIIEESLYGDVLRLRQIFVNIISNAIKYTPDGGVIKINVSEKMSHDRCLLTLECGDNGIGMTPEFVARIFEPFERVNNSTLSGIEGTGLGMSIVKKLTEAMGGSINVESEKGKGTTVTLCVPLRFKKEQIRSKALEGKKLLIIESDEELAALYKKYLGEFGISYSIVSSSSEAISAITEADFRDDGYSMVILGRSVGKNENIFELASYLHKANGALTIILVSDADWDTIEYHATRSGITHFIPVPFFRSSLINGLVSAFDSGSDETSDSLVPDLAGKHILLAEDNLINREIACEILSVTNAKIDCAENGKEAFELFEKSDPGFYDTIFMDIQMPVMDGYTAVEKIRASNRSDAASVPIWAMTANAFAEDIQKAKDAGMNGHLAKPIDIKLLMQILRQLA